MKNNAKYIIESHFRGDKEDVTGPRCHFRRYVADVYLENAKGSSGSFKLNCDNGFLYYLGNVPIDGIETEIEAPREVTTTAGLQHFRTPSIEVHWKSEDALDGTKGKCKVVRLMLCFAEWGMGYEEIEKRKAEEILFPFPGYQATVDSDACEVSENRYLGIKDEDFASDYKEEEKSAPCIDDITVDGTSIRNYCIVYEKNSDDAKFCAECIGSYISEKTGIVLDITDDTASESAREILVGSTSRKKCTATKSEEYEVYFENGKIYVLFGDEQSAELAACALCEKMLGCLGEGSVTALTDEHLTGSWSVLCRYAVMADTHVGVRYNWKNYDWLYNAFDNFERIHKENPLDFVISLGDSIDDGYRNTYETDYKLYLEEFKRFRICDAENPIENRAEGTIPHYELCGNHDPIGGETKENGELKIRFFRNKLWYTENADGEKVAHIGFFTNYGGYPLHEFIHCNSYESYRSYGKANDMMVEFVATSIEEAKAEGAKMVVLYNHFGIAQDMGAPVLPESGLGKIANVCKKYGIKLFFSGHEHDIPYTLRKYKDLYDYDVSMTCLRHGIVELTTLRAKVTIYNSKDNTVFRTDTIPLGKFGSVKQVY